MRRLFDHTDLMKSTTEIDGTVVLTLEIDDAEPLPDVVPEGHDEGSGFDATVDDWSVLDVNLDAD